MPGVSISVPPHLAQLRTAGKGSAIMGTLQIHYTNPMNLVNTVRCQIGRQSGWGLQSVLGDSRDGACGVYWETVGMGPAEFMAACVTQLPEALLLQPYLAVPWFHVWFQKVAPLPRHTHICIKRICKSCARTHAYAFMNTCNVIYHASHVLDGRWQVDASHVLACIYLHE